MLELAAALLFGGPESFRGWLHGFVDRQLAERGVDAEGLERKAMVYKGSIELAQAIGEHVALVCETAAADDIMEMGKQQLQRLLPSPYDNVQQALSDRAENVEGSSHYYDWAVLADVVLPFAEATGAIDADDLDPMKVAQAGNSARLQAAVPALRRVIQDADTSVEDKVSCVQEVMGAVKDKQLSPHDIRRRFRDDAERVAAERVCRNGHVRWNVAPMTEAQDAVGRRLCSVFLDFNAPVVLDLTAEE